MATSSVYVKMRGIAARPVGWAIALARDSGSSARRVGRRAFLEQ